MEKYLIIDFDSTFIKTETLDELSKICLQPNLYSEKILSDIKTITNKAMIGKIDFKYSLMSRLKLINISLDKIEEVITILKDDISTSIINNKMFFIENSKNIYIVSGGFIDIIEPIVSTFNIKNNHIIANSFIYRNSTVVGCDEENDLLKKEGKVIAVNKLNLNGEIIVVGDGYTDYEIKKCGAADTFIAFSENISRQSVIQKADIIADNFDVVINEFMK